MKIRYTVMMCLAGLLASCATPSENTLSQMISVPGQLELYNPLLGENLTASSASQGGLRIYTLVDVSCSTCILKLEKWDKLQAEVQSKRVSIIPICYSKDNFELLRFLFESKKIGKLNFPLYLDLNNKFKEENKALVSETGELAVLTDGENRVLLSGNPLEDEKVREKYMAQISALQ